MKKLALPGILFVTGLSSVAVGAGKFSIVGTWAGTAPDGTVIQYVFTKNGGVTWFVKEKGFKKMFPKGLIGKYKITFRKPLSYLDISNFTHPAYKSITFHGIFKVINSKSMKFQGMPNHAGPRPTKFTNQAIVFKMVK